MKYLILLICFLNLTFSAFSQKTITVDFTKDGKNQIIKDNFKIYIVVNNPNCYSIFCPTINGNSFKMPLLDSQQKGFIIFQHKDYWIGFNEEPLSINQNMHLIFGLDKSPIDNSEINVEKGIKYYTFLIYDPLETGSSTMHTLGIKNIKAYTKNLRKTISFD